ncbi:MAG: cysteine-rich CWC family protein [Thaumarchaeota archaeon]|nr:cysteine-rich CWC family protein [Nitrososphaerota archaeon]
MGPLTCGCWCSEVKTAQEHRAEISSKARDCVCPHCLNG